MAVGTSNFPTTLDTAVELIQPANNAQTTLSGNLTDSATSIVVVSTALFSPTGLIAIGNELITYTGKTSTTFTGCIRGYDGTTPAAHLNGARVEDLITKAHHNVLAGTVIALETKLGSGASVPAANTVLRGTGAGTSAFGQIVNADIDPAAAIPYSKLSLTGTIVNADISATAAIAYSKLALTGAIVNADISATAAIAYSKLALSGAIVNADISATAAIAYSKLALTGSIVDADVSASAAIAYSKLATMAVNQILASDASGKVSASSLTWNSGSSIVGAIKGLDLDGVTTLPVANRILWNSDYSTLMLGLTSNVAIPVGQAEAIQCKRSTNNGLAKGKVVYVVGSDGANKTVAYAQANSGTTCKTTLGVVAETVSGGAKGFVTSRGLLTGLNTSALTEGQVVFLSSSSAGDLTSTPPTPPNHRVKVGYCVKQHATEGVLFVDVQTGYDVGELCDAAITGTPVAGSLLIRNATAGTWVNATLTAGTGVAITNGDGSITINATGAAAGSAGDYQINSGSGFAAGVLAQSSGRLTATPTAVTSGVAPFLRIVTPADSGLTASTEAPGIVFGGDGSGSTVTRTRAAGAVTTQREYVFTAPTYAAASATTITTAATLAITGAPVAGTNTAITYPLGLFVQSGDTRLAGNLFVGTNLQVGGSPFSPTTSFSVSIRDPNGPSPTSASELVLGNNASATAFRLLMGNSGYNFLGGASSINFFHTVSGPMVFYCNSVEAIRIDASQLVGINKATSIGAQIHVVSGSSSCVGLRVDTAATPSADIVQFTNNGTNRWALNSSTTTTVATMTMPNGGTNAMGAISENVTLSTVGATTDTTIQIPANSLVLGVTVRVTTGITGIDSTSLQIGDATTAARFGSIAAFTAGTTGVGLAHLQGGISTDAAGPIVTSATAVRLTLAGGTDNTPSAGAVRVTIHYISLTAPTS